MTGSSAVTAIERFEESTKLHDFKQFHIEQARAFKKHLTTACSERTGKPLSVSTTYAVLGALKAFFI